jgi:hypothetical protein
MIYRSAGLNVFWDYLIVTLLIACSGIPYFVGSYYLMPLSFLLVFILCVYKGVALIDLKLLFALIFLLTIAVLREILHDYPISFYILLVIVLKYSFPFYVFKLTKLRFLNYYRQILYIISIISLIVFALITVIPSFEEFLIESVAPFFTEPTKGGYYTYAPNFIIYTLNEHGRNHGPFWEAGGFGVFLILAIIFQLIEKKSLFDKYGIVYIIAAITTFSTATYIALGVLISIYILRLGNKNFRLFLIPIIVFIFFKVYYTADFLKTKISTNYDVISGHYENRVANRFTSVLLDLNKIQENPVFGNPQNTGERYTIYSHRNNGLSSMAVEYGIIYSILFFLLTGITFKRLLILNNKYDLILSFSFMIAIMAVYFGQVLTDKPILNLLALLPFLIRRQKSQNYDRLNI